MKKANKPAKPAILPANKQDPTGVDRLERGAMRDFSKRLRKIGKGYIELLNRIPSEPAVNQRYTFRLDQNRDLCAFAVNRVAVDAVPLPDLIRGVEVSVPESVCASRCGA